MNQAGLNFTLPFGKYKGLTIKQILTDLPDEFKYNIHENADWNYVEWLSTILKQGLSQEVFDLMDKTRKIKSYSGGDMMSRSINYGY